MTLLSTSAHSIACHGGPYVVCARCHQTHGFLRDAARRCVVCRRITKEYRFCLDPLALKLTAHQKAELVERGIVALP